MNTVMVISNDLASKSFGKGLYIKCTVETERSKK